MNKEVRRVSRIIAIEAFFAYLERGQKISLEDSFNHVVLEVEEKVPKDDFAWEIVEKSAENFAKMKLVIRAFAPEFPFEKIAPINRVILILGLTEMKYIKTPPVVVINEYIEIAKLFGEQKSAGFINGVLDAFRKQVGLEREEKGSEELVEKETKKGE